MKKPIEQNMLRAVKINTEKDQKVREPLWITEEIKQEIEERKRRKNEKIHSWKQN